MVTVIDWGAELDHIARTQPGRTPLRPDPVLAAALADDQHGLPLCADCDQPMRPKNTKSTDWPGTVSRSSRGQCGSCQRRSGQRRGRGRGRALNITTGTPCLGCHRPLRSSHTSAADAPGTLYHQGRGMCKTCHERHP